MPLVGGRAALIRAGVAVLGRDLAGPGEALFSGRSAGQELLGLGRDEMPRTDGGETDSSRLDGVSGQPDGRAGRGDRPVADPAAHLRIRAAAAGPDSDPD